MSGRNKDAENGQMAAAQQQASIAQQQLALGQQYSGLASTELARRTALEQPAIQFNSALASGDRGALLSAAALPISNITHAAEAAKAAAYNNAPAGAARDFALTQIDRGKSDNVAQFINQAFLGSHDALSKFGAEALQSGLQQEGAGLRGTEGGEQSTAGSAQTYNTIQQQAAQRKASTMNLIGQLAGIGGGIATGGLTSAAKTGAKAGVSALGASGALPTGFPAPSAQDLGGGYPVGAAPVVNPAPAYDGGWGRFF